MTGRRDLGIAIVGAGRIGALRARLAAAPAALGGFRTAREYFAKRDTPARKRRK